MDFNEDVRGSSCLYWLKIFQSLKLLPGACDIRAIFDSSYGPSVGFMRNGLSQGFWLRKMFHCAQCLSSKLVSFFI